MLTGLQADQARPEIWIVSTDGQQSRLVRKDADTGAPSPDGRTIAFTVDDGTEIRTKDLLSGAESSVVKAEAAQMFTAVFWPANGKRVSYQQRSPSDRRSSEIESNFAWAYCSINIHSGRQTAFVRDLPFDSAGETAGGMLFYMRSRPPNELEHNGLGKVSIDPETGVFAEAPQRIYPFHLILAADMSVSSDGSKMTAVEQDWRANIYIGQIGHPGPARENVQRLTTDTGDDYPHGWSSDSQTVYFESGRVNSLYQIFRPRIDSPNADMLTFGDTATQFFPVLMPGGKQLVYEQWVKIGGKVQRSIYRANADASDPKLVRKETDLDEWRCPLLTGTSCVLRELEGQKLFVFYRLDLLTGKAQEVAHSPWMPTVLGDWALSPDGRVAAIPGHDEHNPVIRLVPLDGTSGDTQIQVKQQAQLWGIHRSADGQEFYAESRIGSLHRLESISLSGKVQTMRQTSRE